MDVGATVQNTLTGRENVILYGRMMGWSYRQTRSRTDEILEFAGLTGAADRLVKHYSSGMNVRLGFAMASYIEPSILIVDEALAVGDADFKRKCLQRMREIVDGGATLLFVSHSLEQLQSMCRRAVWLDGGVIRESGDSAEVIAAYRASLNQGRIESGEIVSIHSDLSVTPQLIDNRGTLEFDIGITSDESQSAELTVGLSFGEIDPFVTATHRVELLPGTTSFKFSFHDLALSAGIFQVLAAVTEPQGKSLCGWRSIGRVRVQGERPVPLPTGVARTSPIIVDSSIETAQ
jgi:ABC-type sugar transport system ATPase subunit